MGVVRKFASKRSAPPLRAPHGGEGVRFPLLRIHEGMVLFQTHAFVRKSPSRHRQFSPRQPNLTNPSWPAEAALERLDAAALSPLPSPLRRRERTMRGFKYAKSPQGFVSVHAAAYNIFRCSTTPDPSTDGSTPCASAVANGWLQNGSKIARWNRAPWRYDIGFGVDAAR